jgi:hypothetical protein
VKTQATSRPRAKSFLQVDPQNAYQRLKVSPLATTEEIADHISSLRGKAMRDARNKTQRGLGDAEEEILRLQQIEEEIGKSDARERYDEQHPQNVLLTVQPSLAEQAWLRHRQAGLISEWICDELAPEDFVPSLRCLKLWTPSGLDEQLLALLSQFVHHEGSLVERVDQTVTVADDAPPALLPSDLVRLLKEETDV